MKPRLYVDMDGTLAQFYESAGCVERYSEKGFFEKLKPYRNVVAAINLLRSRYGIDVAFLSAADESSKKEKVDWLKRYMTSFNQDDIKCFFPPVGMAKGSFIRKRVGHAISPSDVLLDDCSGNLVDWKQSGGTGIKLLNELNGRGWNSVNWKGHCVSYDRPAEEIAERILNICGMKGKKL